MHFSLALAVGNAVWDKLSTSRQPTEGQKLCVGMCVCGVCWPLRFVVVFPCLRRAFSNAKNAKKCAYAMLFTGSGQRCLSTIRLISPLNLQSLA